MLQVFATRSLLRDLFKSSNLALMWLLNLKGVPAYLKVLMINTVNGH